MSIISSSEIKNFAIGIDLHYTIDKNSKDRLKYLQEISLDIIFVSSKRK